MNRQLTITTEPIDEAALPADRRLSGGAGAVIQFLGVVRGEEQGRRIRALEYESFQRMAEHVDLVELVKAEAMERDELPTRRDVLRRINKDRKQAERRDMAANVVEGKYAVIMADPPWQYQNSGFDEAADSFYPTMPTEAPSFAGLEGGGPADRQEYFRQHCRFFREMGYDTVSYEVCISQVLPGRLALCGGQGPVQTRARLVPSGGLRLGFW